MPVLTGRIDRRILINYRVAPECVSALLPEFLEPLIINGYASAGICLLRLKDVRVKGLPAFAGVSSENAAHRFLVRFRGSDERYGVYIPRRETNSLLNVFVAGKLFSWPHYPADFQVEEGRELCVCMSSDDGLSKLNIKASRCDHFPADSMFDSFADASRWFQRCSIGISPSETAGRFISTELKTKTWTMSPLKITALKSSYFDNKTMFPADALHFDNALLMEGIEHEWVNSQMWL